MNILCVPIRNFVVRVADTMNEMWCDPQVLIYFCIFFNFLMYSRIGIRHGHRPTVL